MPRDYHVQFPRLAVGSLGRAPPAARAPSARGSGRRGGRGAGRRRRRGPRRPGPEQAGGAVALGAGLLGRGRGVRRPGVLAAAGEAGELGVADGGQQHAVARRERTDQGQQAAVTAEGSSGVSSTTSARCRPRESTAPTSERQFVSASTGCSPAIACCIVPDGVAAVAGLSRLRTARSPATIATWSPAREASAVSSSAASIAESRRGTSSTRPAEVRPVSRTSSTRRSRSGCQVRTTTDRVRALARQSTLRTSSPSTYSRSESNSVP